MKSIFAVCFTAAGLSAQLTGGNATISGSVMDPTGALVPNATVIAANTETHNRERTQANAAGSYTFRNLPAGHYSVEVLAPGFALFHADDLAVVNGGTVRADARLSLGRLVETMHVVAGLPAASPMQKVSASQENSGQKPVRIGGAVMAANLIRKVTSAYPADMKEQRQEAAVVLQAVISKEGVPQSLSVQSPDVNRSFVDAAMDAVEQWRYRPTLLNGEPVEVITTITINFTLSQ